MVIGRTEGGRGNNKNINDMCEAEKHDDSEFLKDRGYDVISTNV